MNDPVVIIGGGFGGLCAAFELAKRRSRLGQREIILIDRASHHLYTPLLYEVATGFDPHEADDGRDRAVEEELAAGAAFSFARLADRLRRRGIRLLDAEVTGVDFSSREVVMSGRPRLRYGQLVLAPGSETDFYDVPGLREHAYPLKTLPQALGIRRALRAAILKKQRGEEAHISVMIGGAGPTGVELLAELVNFFEKFVTRGALAASDYTISIVEANARLLPMLHPWFSAAAKHRLERQCVKMYLDTCIKSVEKGKVILAPRPLRAGENEAALVCDFRAEKQKEMGVDVLIWTGGVRASGLFATIGLSVDHRGRVAVDAQLRARGQVFAIGDGAVLIDPKTKLVVPGLAQVAVHEARVVAENIAREVSGGSPIAYPFPYLNTIVPLGGKYALADVHGVKFSGFFAWMARQLADIRYFLHILPLPEAMMVWWRGVRMYVKND